MCSKLNPLKITIIRTFPRELPLDKIKKIWYILRLYIQQFLYKFAKNTEKYVNPLCTLKKFINLSVVY